MYPSNFLILAFFSSLLLITVMGAGSTKPSNYKRSTVKTIISWLLMILAIVDFINLIPTTIEDPYKSIKLLPFSILLFSWGLYIFRCGPMNSSIGKRILKTISFIFMSVLLIFLPAFFVILLDTYFDFTSTVIFLVLTLVYIICFVIIIKLDTAAINESERKEEEKHIAELK